MSKQTRAAPRLFRNICIHKCVGLANAILVVHTEAESNMEILRYNIRIYTKQSMLRVGYSADISKRVLLVIEEAWCIF